MEIGSRSGSKTRWLLPSAAEPFRDLHDGPEMVVVPAGKFMMGSPDDEPEWLPAKAPGVR